MLNCGLDFAVLGGRLSGTVEYYNKVTKDLIWNYDVPATQYYVNSIVANVGEIENKGWEFSILAIPVNKRNFSWNTSLTRIQQEYSRFVINDIYKVDYIDTYGVGLHGQSGNRAFRIEGYP